MQKIYKQGSVDVVIPATESIAVYTEGKANVYRALGYPTFPNADDLLGVVNNQETVFGSYTDGATITIEAGADDVFYEVGSDPRVAILYDGQKQGDPNAQTTTATLTAAELLDGIITVTQASGSTDAYVLPTGTLMDEASEFAIGESFDWTLINLSAAAADTATVTAGSGHTVVGTMIVQSAHSTTGLLYGNAVRFRTRKTAANTFVTYRLAG